MKELRELLLKEKIASPAKLQPVGRLPELRIELAREMHERNKAESAIRSLADTMDLLSRGRIHIDYVGENPFIQYHPPQSRPKITISVEKVRGSPKWLASIVQVTSDKSAELTEEERERIVEILQGIGK